MKLLFQNKDLIGLWLLLAFTLLLFVLYRVWKKKAKKRIGDEKLVNALLRGWSPGLFNLKYILLFAALAAGIVAALNPGKRVGSDTRVRKGIDLAVALDVSKSMLAADLAPSRLERAKQFVTRLMEEMPDDRIALILFAGKAYLQMPLTNDHGAAKLFIYSAAPDAVPQQGTVLSDAMEISSRAFSSAGNRYKSVLLISDGEDHDDSAVRTAKEMAGQGIMIITVGAGSAEGAVISDPLTGEHKKDDAGNTVISKLNEELLRSVAGATNGIYISLQGTDAAVSAVKRQLSQIERKAFSDTTRMNFRSLFVWFAAGMFLLLLAETFIPERKKELA